MLLVLDNAEHLDLIDLVIEILHTARDVQILVTSRVRLNAQSEHLYPVTGMALESDQSDANQEKKRSEAAELFLLGARRVCPGFEPQGTEQMAINRLCRFAGGIPLTILLAAAWMETLSPNEILAHLTAQGIDFLSSDWQDMPARQQSVRTGFDYSWQLLSGREQEVLTALTVFRGSFTHEAAQAIAAAFPHDVRALVHRSLLEPIPGGRYEMHELLRQYAAERLHERPAWYENVHSKHCIYYTAALAQWETDLKGKQQLGALAELEQDAANALAAWSWATEKGRTALISQALGGICRYYEWKGLWQEGRTLCQVAAGQIENPTTGEQVRLLAQLAAWQGAFEHRSGHRQQARTLLQLGLNLLQDRRLESQDTRRERAFALLELGRIVPAPEGASLYQESLELYRDLGDQWGQANALEQLSGWYNRTLEYEQAERLLQESLVLWRKLGDRRGIALALNGLSISAARQGRVEECVALARESVSIHRETRDRPGTAESLFCLACHLVLMGEFSAAHTSLEETVDTYIELGMLASLGSVRNILAWAKMNLGLYAQAQIEYEQALDQAQKTGHLHGIGMNCMGLAQLAIRQRAYDRASHLLQECTAILRQIDDRDEEALPAALAGLLAFQQGQLSTARQKAHQVLEVTVKAGNYPGTLFGLSIAALWMAGKGEALRALEICSLVMRHPYFGRSVWRQETIERPILLAAASLSPHAMHAAQQRGRSFELWRTANELLAELARD
jgi:predicted ATPase